MQMYNYTLELAGIRIPCAFRFPDTASWFGAWITGPADGPGACAVPEADWAFWPQTGKPADAFAEYSMFSAAASTALLPHRRCLVHAAAFRHGDGAWLIAAGPGVGKSTQLRTLQEEYPGEFSVICGDRPLLEARDDGTVTVHPSPWNGKEGWHGAAAAPLKGVILLRRGGENAIVPCGKEDAAAPVYRSIFQSAETVEILEQAAAMATSILTAASVWSMTTDSVPASTRRMYERLFTEESDTHDV